MRKDNSSTKPSNGKKTKSGKGKTTASSSTAEPINALQDVSNSSRSNTKKRKDTDGDELEAEVRPAKKQRYIRLEAQIKETHQDVINETWRAAPQPAQERAKAILTQCKRAIIGRCRNPKTAEEAEKALKPLLIRLEKRLPRMPYPRRTTDVDFNLDALLEKTRRLEAHLVPIKHTQQLLDASLDDESAALQSEQADLKQFRHRIHKDEKRLRRQRAEPVPELSSHDDNEAEPFDSADNIGLKANDTTSEALFETQDPDIEPLMTQFSNHLVSIQSNIEQLSGLDDDAVRTGTLLGCYG